MLKIENEMNEFSVKNTNFAKNVKIRSFNRKLDNGMF